MNSHGTKQKRSGARKTASAAAATVEKQPVHATTQAVLGGIVQQTQSAPDTLTPPAVALLQRTIGNRALNHLMRPAQPRQPKLGQSASRGLTVQPKLQVGPAGDQYEQEADRVAAQVLAMPAPQAAAGQPPVQRTEEEEPAVQAGPQLAAMMSLIHRTPLDEADGQAKPLLQPAEVEVDAPTVQTQTHDPREGFEAGGAFEDRLRAQQGAGRPLPGAIRDFMEPRFGADFSSVRLHTGSEAAQLNRAISAQAFTSGADIYLGEGQENVASSAGQELLAHELTHTIQQGAAPVRRRLQPAPAADDPAEIQRHSEAALQEQINAAALEDDELIQTKRAERPGQLALIQRHPIAPPQEMGHEASFGERKTEAMKRIAGDPEHIKKVRAAISQLISDTLTGADQLKKLEQIKTVQWQFDEDVAPANPAQVKGGVIRLFVYHPNWYYPDGSPRVEFTRSTVLHEGLHYISHNHEGFQTLEKLNVHSTGSLAGADTLDEAVTDRIGAELAEKVLGATEAYTTNYWNLEARRGLDFHFTLAGLELLAKGQPKLWLGKMIDVIMALTGLTWAEIKKAYLSDDPQDAEIKRKIDSQRPAIGARWKEESTIALQAQMGAQAVPQAKWLAELKASVSAVNVAAAAPAAGAPGQPVQKVRKTRDEIKAAVDAQILLRVGAAHEVVALGDARSSSTDDWKIVRDNTPNIDPPGTAKKYDAWNESATEKTWGLGSKAPDMSATGPLIETEKKANPHTQEYQTVAHLPDLKLAADVWKANKLLGGVATRHPLGWVIIPDSPIKAKDKFSTYPPEAIKLLQLGLRNQSLSSLAGAPPELAAHAVITNMGGAGYEANGEFAAINVEHVNLATIVHEMGHHKQNKEQGFNEQSINQIKGVMPLLDLHNILISENKIAAAELKRNPQSDPYVRLRYKQDPERLRLSDWKELAKNQVAESANYKRFRDRLTIKGGKLLEILDDIDRELRDNPLLYPGNIPNLFKNLMVAEIIARNGNRPVLEVEKVTDIGHKQ